MIEAHVREACVPLAVPGGKIILLGDQIPSFGSGFKTNAEWAASLGMTCRSIDYDGKADILHDLNYPIDAALHGTADILYDGGVLEHVANIGQAWRSCVKIVKLGGHVLHCNPINCYGGAYYGIDPMLFRDLYRANGFTVLRDDVYCRTGWRWKLINMVHMYCPPAIIAALKRRAAPATRDFMLKDEVGNLTFTPLEKLRTMRFLPHLAHTFFIARKDREVAWQWPAQGCYPRVTETETK